MADYSRRSSRDHRSSHRHGFGSRSAGEGQRAHRGGGDGAPRRDANRNEPSSQRSERGSSGVRGQRPDRTRRRDGSTFERPGRAGQARRDSRPPQRHRVPEPALPEDVTAAQLDASARRELRGLGRLNAENVARHLVMVQQLLDSDPQRAYEHARYAASHAGRIAVVREAGAISAYLSGHYQDALRDLRAARRLSGLDLHRAIEADCERALGNLHRALKVAEQADPRQLDDVEEAELAMVVSSVRHELGQTELGLIVIEEAIMMFRGDRETLRRLHSVRADRLEQLGRRDEAEAVRRRIGQAPEEPEPDVEVYDVVEESAQELADAAAHEAGATATEQDGAADVADAADEADEEDDSQWDSSFSARVQAEMDELLAAEGVSLTDAAADPDPAQEPGAGEDAGAARD